jgi:hypothetical protein
MVPTEASHKSTSAHNDKTTTVRRAHASLRTEAGRCWLSAVGCVPEAVFSPALTGRRASDEGDLPPLRRPMTDDSKYEITWGVEWKPLRSDL